MKHDKTFFTELKTTFIRRSLCNCVANSLLVKYLIFTCFGHFNISQWESPVNNSSESKFLDSGRLDFPTPAPCILDNFGQAISCRSWGIRRSSCKGKKFSDRFRWAKESCAHFASRLSLGNLASGLLSTGKYSKCPGIRLQVNSWRAEREVAEVQRNVSQKWNTLQKKTLRTGGAGCRSISAARSLFWDLRHVQITAAPVVISAVTIWVFSTNGILKMVSNIHLQFPFIKGKFDICLGKPLCKSHPGDCNNFGV